MFTNLRDGIIYLVRAFAVLAENADDCATDRRSDQSEAAER